MLARLLAQVHSYVLALLFPLRADEAIVAALATDELLAVLDPELVPLGEGLCAVTLLPFVDDRVRGAIHEAKYQGNATAFALLALVLSEYVREATEEDFERRSYALVPVPLGSTRRTERGYNQIEEVALLVSKELGIPIKPALLARSRETLSQVSLPRHKRLVNMKGAFACTRPVEPRITYILLDDVLTTGATLLAATIALRDSGAENILAIALAH